MLPERAVFRTAGAIAIDLVEEGEDGGAKLEEAAHPAFIFEAGRGGGVEEEENGIGAFRRMAGQPVHEPAQVMGGLMGAGGVDENELPAGFGEDAADGAAGGLGDGADDADLFAEQGVEEGGLADIGAPDEGENAGAGTGGGNGGLRHGGIINFLAEDARE